VTEALYRKRLISCLIMLRTVDKVDVYFSPPYEGYGVFATWLKRFKAKGLGKANGYGKVSSTHAQLITHLAGGQWRRLVYRGLHETHSFGYCTKGTGQRIVHHLRAWDIPYAWNGSAGEAIKLLPFKKAKPS
jgi:hypothetical protein